jgi:hypothetical protein
MIGTVLATATISSLLNQLVIAVPSIILASNTLTAALQGVFNIKSGKAVHVMNWVIGILTGLGFVAANGLTFGLSAWLDYVLGGVAGLLGAAASNGLYDWESVKKIFNALTNLFGTTIHGEAFERK